MIRLPLALLLALGLAFAPASTGWGSGHGPPAWEQDTSNQDKEEEDESESIDPLEPMNRAIFALNEALDAALLLPLARAWRAIVPGPVRNSFRNFIRNLGAPLVLAHDILQGEGMRAQTTLGRFMVNTTFGAAGLFDVAKNHGLPYHDEDLGQTLAVWGMKPGAYLVLPLLGPSTLRDGFGTAGDIFMNPLYHVGAVNPEVDDAMLGLRAGQVVDTRERLIEPIEELKSDPLALDHYILFRSVFLQRRQNAIRNKNRNKKR